MHTLKEKGYIAENIVKWDYINKGWSHRESNWTIPGGEIDLICETDDEIRFIEVKCINTTEDLENYISKKKLLTLERAIETYINKYNIDKTISLDIAFVKDNHIIEIYHNISNS